MLGIGLLFPQEVSAKLDDIRKEFGTERVRQVVPHITLKQPFEPKVEVEVIIERLRSVAGSTGPFLVELDGFDYFEGERNLAFIAVKDAKALSDLHHQIVSSLSGLGAGGEEHELDRFVAHVTIHDGIPKDELTFYKAKVSERRIRITAEMSSFVLFANDGLEWKHVATFPLTGEGTSSGWDRIYRRKGDLGFRVLPKISTASKEFKKRNYRDILDLGCGTGKHSIFLAKKGFHVEATDLSSAGIEIAREKAMSLGMANVHFRQHDMKTIPFQSESFDAVICTWTIYHGTLSEIRETLGETRRVLRRDGLFITDFLSVEDSTCGRGKEIEKNTFIGQKPEEEDVPHHYSTKDEVVRLMSGFGEAKIRSHSRAYVDAGIHYVRKYFDVQAVR